MAKVIHLKNEKGVSFTVTKHAFETTIKTDPKWKQKYDYVGEVDEEEFAHKSESAMTSTPAPKKDTTDKVTISDKEESTDHIFNSNNSNSNDNEQEEQVQTSESNGTRNESDGKQKRKSGNKK